MAGSVERCSHNGSNSKVMSRFEHLVSHKLLL